MRKIDLKASLFEKALPILNCLETAGYEAVFVGGAVRDYLLNHPIHDVDIATSAFPNEVKQLFKKTVDVGIQHGTVMVLYSGNSYEITTFRTENGYEDSRHPDSVQFVRSLVEDLKRRDFTINALAIDRKGVIFDYYNGLQDLDNSIIRAVGVADERFAEDALRLMRAIRFMAQLDFVIEPQTWKAILNHASNLAAISVERIANEWHKTVLSPFSSKGIKAFVKSGLFYYCPNYGSLEDKLRWIADNNLNFTSEASYWACLSYLCRFEISRMVQTMKAWKLSNQLISDASVILKNLRCLSQRDLNAMELFETGERLIVETESIAKQLTYSNCELPDNGVSLLSDESVSKLQKNYSQLPIKSKKELAINGKQLMEIVGLTPGPKVGELLDAVLSAVVSGKVTNETSKLIDYCINNGRLN